MKRPCNCNKFLPGRDYDPSRNCRLCWLFAHDQRYREMWSDSPSQEVKTGPCRFLGPATGEVRECPSCQTGRVKLKVFSCAVHGQCVQAKKPEGMASCEGCSDRQTWPVQFNERNLAPGQGGNRRFNPSLLAHEEGYLLAWRDSWSGSEIWLSKLDKHLRPQGASWRLNLFHPDKANWGREDPRLFRHRGKVHVSFIGVTGKEKILYTSQLYASLNHDLQVERIYCPYYPQRNSWEKNWFFLSHAGDLYAGYSVAPHRILRVEEDRAWMAHETPFFPHWEGGEMRGGAAPVLVGDEWWHFFHDRTGEKGREKYRCGLYTFENKPPFRVKSFCPSPLITADRTSKPDDQYVPVIWAGGAVFNGDHWLLACGAHDSWAEVYRFDHKELEGKLRPVLPPEKWSHRPGQDVEVFAAVVGLNEYRLPERMDGWTVVDVGGHVGSFVKACKDRGAEKVYVHEPCEENFRHLLENIKGLEGVTHHYGAVTGEEGKVRLVRGPDKNTGGRQTCQDTKGDISSVTLDWAVKGLKVDFLKIDCEGCEYEALKAFTLWESVDQIALEWHNGLQGLDDLLRSKGYSVDIVRRGDKGGLLFARRK